MNNTAVKQSFDKTVKVLQKKPLLLLGATLVAVFVSAITLGILGMVTYIGLASIILLIDKGKTPKVSELFMAMEKLIPLLLLGLIMGIVISIGFVFLIVPGLIVAALWMYAPFAMVRDNKGIVEALNHSKDIVMKNGLFEHIVIVLIIGVVNSVGGGLLAGIGILLTFPVTTGFVVFMYEKIKGTK